MRTKLKLIGCGGHCKVVLDALTLMHSDYAISLCDSNEALLGHEVAGYLIDSTMDTLSEFIGLVHLTIGNNKVREKIVKILHRDASLLSIKHPKAIIAQSALIKQGAFIAAGAILAPESSVGKCTIINHSAIIDHEVVVGDYTHIAPNVTLGGQVQVGHGALIGAGAVVLPGIKIGDGAIVAAGAVVTKDVNNFTTVIGVPALPKE